jgi:hypothetical protein
MVVPIRNPTLFGIEQANKTFDLACSMGDFVHIERPYGEPRLLLGTSAFTTNGWVGSFYLVCPLACSSPQPKGVHCCWW